MTTLIDTSVLVDFLSGRETNATSLFERMVAKQQTFYLTSIVVQEILQGARDTREWDTLDRYLRGQLLANPEGGVETAAAAARIFFDCRRRGWTVRSTVDCLIAQIALENDLTLLHSDRDFDVIARLRPLKTLP
jgi:predicted nucleic acid-binding protein